MEQTIWNKQKKYEKIVVNGVYFIVINIYLFLWFILFIFIWGWQKHVSTAGGAKEF